MLIAQKSANATDSCFSTSLHAHVLNRFSLIGLFVTLWTVAQTVAHQDPLSMGFYRQGYWGGLPCPLPGDLPNSGIEPTSPVSPALQADSLPTKSSGKPFPLDQFSSVQPLSCV